MKKKEINQRWKCPVFRVTVHFMTGPVEDIKKFCTGIAGDEDEFTCGGVWQLTKTNGDDTIEKEFLVWLEDKTSFYYLVHETAHLVQHIFEFLNITYSQENREAIAYYQEYWTRKIWHIMSKRVEYKSKAKSKVTDKKQKGQKGKKAKNG